VDDGTANILYGTELLTLLITTIVAPIMGATIAGGGAGLGYGGVNRIP